MPDEFLIDDYALIALEIGCKGDLTTDNAIKWGKAFHLARVRHPTSPIAFCIGGYDDDPREIYNIPEVARYIRIFAMAANLTDWRDAIKIPWEPSYASLAVLQMCGVFASDSPIKVNVPTNPPDEP